MTSEEAKAYTGIREYWGLSGETQLELLRNESLRPDNCVLEIGCGSLNAAIPIINYLDKGNYAGIEPKSSLIEVVKSSISADKEPVFLYNKHFDLTEQCKLFDYVIGHSVFSHAPQWQFIQCLHNIVPFLKKNCKLYFSLHLGEDSKDVRWKDSGNTFYSVDFIRDVASKLRYNFLVRMDLKEFFMSKCPRDYHDWVQLIKL